MILPSLLGRTNQVNWYALIYTFGWLEIVDSVPDWCEVGGWFLDPGRCWWCRVWREQPLMSNYLKTDQLRLGLTISKHICSMSNLGQGYRNDSSDDGRQIEKHSARDFNPTKYYSTLPLMVIKIFGDNRKIFTCLSMKRSWYKSLEPQVISSSWSRWYSLSGYSNSEIWFFSFSVHCTENTVDPDISSKDCIF